MLPNCLSTHFREKPQKPKNADVSKICFLNNSSLANGINMKFGPKLHIIKRIILKKKIFEILLTSALYCKFSYFADFCWRQQNLKKNYAKMFLLIICNFGPNFMFIPLTKLELFKKLILLTSAFFGFCGFSQNWQNLNLSNTDFHFLHHNALL